MIHPRCFTYNTTWWWPRKECRNT